MSQNRMLLFKLLES